MSSSQQQQQQQPHHHHRLTSRQVQAQNQRRTMNERRQKFSHQIRKQKKSNWLAQKRGVAGTANTNATNHNNNNENNNGDALLFQAMGAFVQQQENQRPNIVSFQAFHQVLVQASPGIIGSFWTQFSGQHIELGEDPRYKTHLDLAQQLVTRLWETILFFSPQPQHQQQESSQQAALLAVQMASLLLSSSTTTHNNDASYYGRAQPTWNDLFFIQDPNSLITTRRLTVLHTLLVGCTQQINGLFVVWNYNLPTSNPSQQLLALDVLEQVCGWLGNWTQEYPVAATVLRKSAGVVGPLTTILHTTVAWILDHNNNDNTSSSQQRQQQRVLNLTQAITWALVHILKGDVTASGWDYCEPTLDMMAAAQMEDTHNDNDDFLLWNPKLAHKLLTLWATIQSSSSSEPAQKQPRLLQEHPPSATSLSSVEKCGLEISVQTAWILVHLSQREDEIVDFLLQPQEGGRGDSSSSQGLLSIVLEQLYRICHGIHQQLSHVVVEQPPAAASSPNNYLQHPLLEPCLEVLGHWATACHGRYVPALLTTTISPTAAAIGTPQQQISLLELLEQLLQWGQEGLFHKHGNKDVYLQVLWLAGCLLCDAGLQNHPSTVMAAPTLIPLLTRGLQDEKTLDCKREGVLALWNAIHTPPAPPANNNNNADDNYNSSQLQTSPEALLSMLQLILASSQATTTSSDNHSDDNGYRILMALKDLLASQDTDAMLASLHLIDAILRHIPSSRVTFQEVDGTDALEAICDLPLMGNKNDTSTTTAVATEEAADMAADLIDDFFDTNRLDDDSHDQFADPVLAPAQVGGTFAFGFPGGGGAGASALLQPQAGAPPIFMPTLDFNNNNNNSSGLGIPSSLMGSNSPIRMNPTSSVGGDPMASGMGRGHGRGRGRGTALPAWAVNRQQPL